MEDASFRMRCKHEITDSKSFFLSCFRNTDKHDWHMHPNTHRDLMDTHILDWKGSYQECKRTRNLKNKEDSQRMSFFLFFNSSYVRTLAVCVCVGKSVHAGMSLCCFDYACVSSLQFGWLLWCYWVSGKPARKEPMGCTKCDSMAGEDRGAGLFHLKGRMVRGLDDCTAGSLTATGAWLELSAYKLQPS